MNTDIREIFANAVEHALRTGLESSSTTFSSAEAAPPTLGGATGYVASIGFAGDARGTLTIVTTERVIRAMSPDDVREHITDEAVARDVLGEHANMTLGRIKTQLLRSGVTIMLAVPTTLTARELELSRPSEGFSEWRVYACEAGSLHVRVDADLSTCQAVEPGPAEEAPMTEGELMLF